MRLPTDAELESLKKEATAKGSEAFLLPYDSLDVAVVVRSMTAREFATFADANTRSGVDSNDGAFADFVMWPPPVEADALAEQVPALAGLVTEELVAMAGQIPADPDRDVLDAGTDPKVLVRAGLPSEKAAALVAQYNHPRQLSILRFPSLDMNGEGSGFALVVRVPPKAIFRARLTAYQKAKADCSGIWDQAVNAARDFVVWSSADLDAIFARWPGVVTNDLMNQFAKMGGSGAKTQRRRL